MEINALKEQINRLDTEKDQMEIQLKQALDKIKIHQENLILKDSMLNELNVYKDKFNFVTDQSLQIKMVMNLVW